ncbi:MULTISPECIES: microcompartment protein PduM [Escherichia]|uniref:microcompartment protein PduM n=1 Tax=Escherichia TaxID=561 RepID=UPI0001FB66A4|nr:MULTISPECIES: microcompartment protein PduM [Escherichia]EFL4511511.1 microcompartment protein PduM [Escherichia fergusonii]EFL4515312.1 microcompartment protein PduM [Escherichia fergusonii]EFN0219301.1 microcompartment protein PduM [Escherichia fergusonii]EFO7695624.1 microcompartment protein PduM [Escherichia fergusonii]EGC08099.1 hypothetical protein ERIG_01240 [Escherichia fergusonii B253]
MNSELLAKIVDEVVARLQRRATSVAMLSVAQLREANQRTLFCQYSALHIVQMDMPLLKQIAQCDCSDIAASIIHNALAIGVRVGISLRQELLMFLPIRQLSALPVELHNEYGQHVVLHPGKLLSYTDVLKSGGEIVLLRQKCLVTALAREAAEARNIQLIKQE